MQVVLVLRIGVWPTTSGTSRWLGVGWTGRWPWLVETPFCLVKLGTQALVGRDPFLFGQPVAPLGGVTRLLVG